jgi:biotin-(acetyl-CoA carboxylase) ligase
LAGRRRRADESKWFSPVDGNAIASVVTATEADYERVSKPPTVRF